MRSRAATTAYRNAGPLLSYRSATPSGGLTNAEWWFGTATGRYTLCERWTLNPCTTRCRPAADSRGAKPDSRAISGAPGGIRLRQDKRYWFLAKPLILLAFRRVIPARSPYRQSDPIPWFARPTTRGCRDREDEPAALPTQRLALDSASGGTPARACYGGGASAEPSNTVPV